MEDPSGSYVNDTESDAVGSGASHGGDSSSSNSDYCNLIVNYLPQSMTDSELYSMFVTCGPLVQAKVIRDRKSGYSYGYGFVHFEKVEDADKAIHTLNGLGIQNKTLKVSHARPSTEGIKESNVYVSNMGPDVTEDLVRDIFSTYGNIITLNVLKDPLTGKAKGVAFVRYSKQVEAKDAVSALNGTMMTGYDKPMLVKIAEEHGKNNARFYNPNTWDPNSVNQHHQSHHQPQHHYGQQQPQQHHHNNYYNGGGGGAHNRGYNNHHRGGGHHRGYGNTSGGGGGHRGRGGGRGGNGGNNRYNPMNQGHGGFY